MLFKKSVEKTNNTVNREWKEKNQRYLRHLQRFLDATERIKDEEVKKHIIAQMLKCDLALTEIAEKEMERRNKSYKRE